MYNYEALKIDRCTVIINNDIRQCEKDFVDGPKLDKPSAPQPEWNSASGEDYYEFTNKLKIMKSNLTISTLLLAVVVMLSLSSCNNDDDVGYLAPGEGD